MIVSTNSKTSLERRISADNSKNLTDGSLIDQARRDPTAFAELYRRHYDSVFRYCVHRLFERHIAQDVTSVVFLKVVENFARFKGGDRQFRHWLYKIATNAINQHLRKTARRSNLLKAACKQADTQINDCQSPTDESTEKPTLLRQAMFELRPRYQTIITLRFFENLKLTEIAEVLGSSDGTVRSQLARALARLRKKINAAQTAQQAGGLKNE